MRRRIVPAWSGAVAALMMVVSGPSAGAAGNRIVAIVNDEVITEGDITSQVTSLLRDEDVPAPSPEQEGEMRAALLERLIEQRLIIQEAKRKGASVDSSDVAQRLQQLHDRLGTKEAYERMLQESGLNEEQLKTKIREQLMAQKAIDEEVRAKVVLTPTELAQVAARPVASEGKEEVEAYHLLIRIKPDRSAEQALALANDLRRRISQGEEFTVLAKDYSDDPHAQEGGLLGWIKPGELLPELDHALFSLAPQEVSMPVQTRIGIHLLKAGNRRKLGEEQQDAQQSLQTRLYQQKFSELLQRWLNGLREQAYVQVVDR